MDFKALIHDKDFLLKIAVITCFLFVFIPTTWVTIAMLVIYTSADAIIPGLLSIFTLGASIIALIAVFKKSSTIYVFLYLGFITIFGLFFTILSYVWFFIPLVGFMGMIISVKITNPNRKFIPNFKNRRAQVLTLFALFLIGFPCIVYFFPPTITYSLPAENAAETIEINLTYANETVITPELLNELEQCNNLPNVNVSLTIPILEDMMISGPGETNTTRDPNRPVRGDYEDPDDYEAATREYEQTVIDLVESTAYEDLENLVYLNSSLAVNECHNFYQHGIAIDFMPLLSKREYYMYINDKTIDRFNKTITIFSNWIEKSNLTYAHRGVVIDTERDWGNDLETILDWWDYQPHDEGIAKLGDLIETIRLWEFDWKDGVGEYSDEKWDQLVANKKTYVAGATFGVHIDDLFDLDDAQQNLFKISIMPGKNDPQFDFIGIMTYETGTNSEHAVYGYCKAGDHFFGDSNVPYIYSGMNHIEDYTTNDEEYFDEILRKFRVCQNYGYEFVGMWALISEYCFDTGWCGGFYDFYHKIGQSGKILEMCTLLNTPEDITITFTDFDFAWMHGLVSLLDVYLVTKIRYSF